MITVIELVWSQMPNDHDTLLVDGEKEDIERAMKELYLHTTDETLVNDGLMEKGNINGILQKAGVTIIYPAYCTVDVYRLQHGEKGIHYKEA